MSVLQKEKLLRLIFHEMGSCIVAFSGGVDSSYLAVVAHQELGREALAVTADSPSYPAYQRNVAIDVVRTYGLQHEFIKSAELADEHYVKNAPNRCYFCKHELYARLQALAKERGFCWIVDGNNLDDTGDYRPGRQAGREMEIRSPLIEVGLAKGEIRRLSKRLGLQTWDQPASACLSSRIPYGSRVTMEKLKMIDQGEEILRTIGFRQCRVRHHGDIARIEIAREEMARVFRVDLLDRISSQFKAIGFRYVAIDVDGYRSGALNEGLTRLETPETTRHTGRGPVQTSR